MEALAPNESVEGQGGGLLISLVTGEEHKSTHSIRDFISRPASVKVKCWRISPGSIIVCNFTHGPPPLPTPRAAAAAAIATPTGATNEIYHRRIMGLCSFYLTVPFKTSTNCTRRSLFTVHDTKARRV